MENIFAILQVGKKLYLCDVLNKDYKHINY